MHTSSFIPSDFLPPPPLPRLPLKNITCFPFLLIPGSLIVSRDISAPPQKSWSASGSSVVATSLPSTTSLAPPTQILFHCTYARKIARLVNSFVLITFSLPLPPPQLVLLRSRPPPAPNPTLRSPNRQNARMPTLDVEVGQDDEDFVDYSSLRPFFHLTLLSDWSVVSL